METQTTTPTVLTISATINAPLAKVWDYWTNPEHIKQWNNASPDWHTPKSENDLRIGGKFSARMEARDGSMGFDFEGVYDEMTTNEYIAYTLSDGRKVTIAFTPSGNQTDIVETFEAESSNPPEMQKAGWQAILNSFKTYAETH